MSKSRYNKEHNNIKKFVAGLYTRISREDEIYYRNDVSIESQLIIIKNWLFENEGIEVYDEYIDFGYGGLNFDRPGFNRLMSDIKDGKVNMVIVKDLSRLGRNYIEVSNYLENVFPSMKIRFVAVIDNIDSYYNSTYVMDTAFSLKNILNEEYVRDISNKLRAVKKSQMKAGLYLGSTLTYGYVPSNEDKSKYVIDINAAKVVDMIFTYYESGLDYKEIANELNKLNIFCPVVYRTVILGKKRGSGGCLESEICSKKWNGFTVKNILQDRTYCGDMIHGKRKYLSLKTNSSIKVDSDDLIIVENTHEPIIDRERFLNIQNLIYEKKMEDMNSNKVDILSGLLKCGDCGYSMVRFYKHKGHRSKIFNYDYKCHKYNTEGNAGCSSHKVSGRVIEKVIISAIRSQLHIIGRIYSELMMIIDNEIINCSSEKIKDEIIQLDKKLLNVREEKLKYYTRYRSSEIRKSDFLRYSKKLDNDIKIFNYKIDKYRLLNTYKEDIFSFIEWASRLLKYKNFKKITRELLEEYIDRVVVFENEKMVVYTKVKEKSDNAKLLIDKVKELL